MKDKKDWKWFEDRIIEIVCNRCLDNNENCCERCETVGEISSLKMYIEDMKNGKILL